MDPSDLQLIPAPKLRQLLGGVSDMTLYRWLKAGTFPPPVIAGNRRYWRTTDVAQWQEASLQSIKPKM